MRLYLTTMACKTYRLMTWNINGLRSRFTDLHSYVITTCPDLISLQEVGPEILPLHGYNSYTLGCSDGSSRGLVMYVKESLPCTLKEKGICNGVEYIIVRLTFHTDTVLFANLYVHANSFHITNLPGCLFEDKSVIMGDLNARHKDLGSFQTSNVNGTRFKAFLESTNTVQLTGENIPTHIQGGRLDYVVFINLYVELAETHLLRHLLSDHFALETTLPLAISPFLRDQDYEFLHHASTS